MAQSGLHIPAEEALFPKGLMVFMLTLGTNRVSSNLYLLSARI
ncbi:MAG: hypothetical protein CM1200mP27_01400 [Chloroflexota bacterium]|nr:MAG: hypothetical protein CM1200mP27_01400 [Chloroflexota bacterium]